MKKVLLFVMAVMAFAGMSVAQSFYTVGYYKPSWSSDRYGVLNKNGERYDNCHVGTGDCGATGVAVNPDNGDVYWAVCNENDHLVYIRKTNDSQSNTYNAIMDAACVNSLYWHYTPTDFNPDYRLWAAGYKLVNGKKYAAIWRGSNGTSVYSPNAGDGRASEANDVFVSKGSADDVENMNVYWCGYRENTSGVHCATYWKNDVEHPLSTRTSTAMSIAYFNGNVYTAGYEKNENGVFVAKVWYNDVEKYTLTDGTADGYAVDIKIVDGDIWVCGWDNHTCDCRIWKNGQVYESVGLYGGVDALEVNSQGTYALVNRGGHCYIYMNGNPIQELVESEALADICVAPEKCDNNGVRTLPYFEGFEMGETDWSCWTKTDEGNNIYMGSEFPSQWMRRGKDYFPHDITGEYFVTHNGGYTTNQEGWLISPEIFLPEGNPAQLTFRTYEQNSSMYQYEGVWVSTTGTDPADFTEVWVQVYPQDHWNTVSIDLSAYKGKVVYIAFKYQGTSGHHWFIDDIEITALGGGTNTITEIYIDGFTTPVYGAHPDFDLTVPSDAHYAIADVEWSTNGHNMALDDVFEESRYFMWVELVPEYGYSFDEHATVYFNGDASLCDDPYNLVNGSGNFETYTIDFDVTNNIPTTYTITTAAFPAEGGIVTGGGPHPSGDVIELIAIPNPGYTFLHWSDGSTDNPLYVPVTGDATYTAIFSGTGVDENGNGTVALYPNPANERLHIIGLEADSEVRIYNSLGMLVKVVTINADDEIDITELSNGLYVVRCGNASLRFVKE